jgi:hypothetical protein
MQTTYGELTTCPLWGNNCTFEYSVNPMAAYSGPDAYPSGDVSQSSTPAIGYGSYETYDGINLCLQAISSSSSSANCDASSSSGCSSSSSCSCSSSSSSCCSSSVSPCPTPPPCSSTGTCSSSSSSSSSCSYYYSSSSSSSGGGCSGLASVPGNKVTNTRSPGGGFTEPPPPGAPSRVTPGTTTVFPTEIEYPVPGHTILSCALRQPHSSIVNATDPYPPQGFVLSTDRNGCELINGKPADMTEYDTVHVHEPHWYNNFSMTYDAGCGSYLTHPIIHLNPGPHSFISAQGAGDIGYGGVNVECGIDVSGYSAGGTAHLNIYVIKKPSI